MSLATNSGKRKATTALAGQFDDSDEETGKLCEAESPVEKKMKQKKDKTKDKPDAPMETPAAEDSREDKSAGRPAKKPKATKSDVSPKLSAQEAIQAALSRVSKPPLSDYEKCSIFPQKLMQLLKNDEAPDAIWWLEDGESFAIEQENFTKVMNKVSRTSKKQVKLDSILRNLYRWGFKKLKDRDLPPNVLAYSHPKFKRDACVELQTFSKKSDPPAANATINAENGPPTTALARALSARAQAGYGDNWNEEGAADKSMLGASVHRMNPYATMMGQPQALYPPQHPSMMMMGGVGDPQQHQRMMFMLQQQQQQQHRQLLLQQELMFHEQQQRQALLFEAAAAEQAYARYGAGAGAGGFPGFPHNPYPF